jgi:hypothetical protein
MPPTVTLGPATRSSKVGLCGMLNDDLSVGATGSEPLRVHDGTHGPPACTEQHVEGPFPTCSTLIRNEQLATSPGWTTKRPSNVKGPADGASCSGCRAHPNAVQGTGHEPTRRQPCWTHDVSSDTRSRHYACVRMFARLWDRKAYKGVANDGACLGDRDSASTIIGVPPPRVTSPELGPSRRFNVPGR